MSARLPLILGIALLIGLLFAGLVLFAFFAFVRGPGEARGETREVSGFTAVNFANYGEMTLIQGDTEGLTIETESDLLRNIRTEVRNGTLTIDFDNRFRIPFWFRMRSPESIRYTLYVKELDRLNLSGAGTIYAQQVAADRLSLVESGAGTITIDRLTADDLEVTISGAGAVHLAGQVDSQDVNLSGLGQYDAGDLESQEAHVNLSGAGSATVWAHERLDTNLSGAGSVNYYGSPDVTNQHSGVGGVYDLGAK